jgi:hypothetical protein
VMTARMSSSSFPITMGVVAILHTCLAITAEQKAAIARDSKEIFPVGYGIMMDAGSTGSRIHVYRYCDAKCFVRPKIPHNFMHSCIDCV